MLCWFFETLEKSLPNKHSSWWRRLQCNIFLSSKTSWRHNCKTSCKHVLKTYCKYVLKKSWRRLEDVFQDENCYAEDVLENKKCLLGCFWVFSLCVYVRTVPLNRGSKRMHEWCKKCSRFAENSNVWNLICHVKVNFMLISLLNFWKCRKNAYLFSF